VRCTAQVKKVLSKRSWFAPRPRQCAFKALDKGLCGVHLYHKGKQS